VRRFFKSGVQNRPTAITVLKRLRFEARGLLKAALVPCHRCRRQWRPPFAKEAKSGAPVVILTPRTNDGPPPKRRLLEYSDACPNGFTIHRRIMEQYCMTDACAVCCRDLKDFTY